MVEKSYIKLNEEFNILKNKLENFGCILKENYYIVDIYMVKKENSDNILDIKDLIILRDFNNEYSKIILHNDEVAIAKIDNIFSTKEILEKLDFVEFKKNMNQDIFVYLKDKVSLKILDIRELGIYLELDNMSDKEHVLRILNDLNIDYVENSEHVNNMFNTFLGEI